METTPPRISIGLPVYNGAKYLRSSLDSILRQDYTDFELIISDNASTDGTSQICEEYATIDKRIRFSATRRTSVRPETTSSYSIGPEVDILNGRRTTTFIYPVS